MTLGFMVWWLGFEILQLVTLESTHVVGGWEVCWHWGFFMVVFGEKNLKKCVEYLENSETVVAMLGNGWWFNDGDRWEAFSGQDIQAIKFTHVSNDAGVTRRLNVDWFEHDSGQQEGSAIGFKGDDKPNFIGSFYSKTKAMCLVYWNQGRNEMVHSIGMFEGMQWAIPIPSILLLSFP
ncbi:unnamed protein product [Lactuca saligna]|uniref:Jacalin-type lectin domain-containing protein n=1 Tax=Lactuca saligna TaxID=75948 RepID=A0AA36E2F6_LACSI|nr:unnamed protein product [Lactuca saligna]